MVKNKTKISVPGFLANGISVGIKKHDQKRSWLDLFYCSGKSSGCIYKKYLQSRASVD